MSESSVIPNQSSDADPRPLTNPLVWALRALCALALGTSGYLAWTAMNAVEVYGCSGDVFDCGHVLSSGWSKWFGIPVSLPAFALYASLLAVLCFVHQNTPPRLLQHIWQALMVGGTMAGLAAVWFIGLQLFAIQHFCVYCLVAHSCGLTIAGIVWWLRPLDLRQMTAAGSAAAFGLLVLITGQLLTPEPQTYIVEHFDDVQEFAANSAESESDDEEQLFAAPDDDIFAPPGDVFEAPSPISDSPPAIDADEVVSDEESRQDSAPQPSGKTEEAAKADQSVDDKKAVENDTRGTDSVEHSSPRVAASLLLFFSPSMSSTLQMLNVQSVESLDEKEQQEPKDADTAESVEAVSPEPRIISAAGGRFRLNAAQWPILGKPTAKFVVVEMFDYTCPHCRNSHRTLKEAFRKYGDDLAIIALAVPLNPACNSSATSRSAQNADACELARISIAVWRVAPDRFREFHDWLFDGGRNRTAAEARKHADQLVGKDLLQKELSQKTASEYISRHVELYRKVGAGSVPKLLFPKSSMTGEVNSLSAISRAIEREFPGQ